MSSPNLRSIYWLKYKLNPTTTLKVASEQNDEPNQSVEIELTHSSDTNSELNQTSSQFCDHANIPTDQPSNHIYTIKVPRLLSKYFCFMYNTGIFPSKYDEIAISRPKCILQQTLFWIFSTLCVLDAIRLTKYNSVGYVHKGDLYEYTIMSYTFLKAFIRLYFVYTLLSNGFEIAKVQKTIHSITNLIGYTPDQYSKSKENWILGLLWTFTIVGSFISNIFGSVTISSGWSIENTIQQKSYQMSEVLHIWTSNSTIVERMQDALEKEYMLETTYLHIFLGIICAVLELIGRIYYNTIDDLVLLAALTMLELMNDFKFEVVKQKQLERYSESVWKHYKLLKNISEEMDSAFGKVFKFKHFSNLIRCGYFLLMLTVNTSYNVNFLIFMITTFKVAVTNFIAAKASSKNKSFRNWLQQSYSELPCIIVGTKHIQTSLILDELTTNPIGLGSDNFHVDEGFIMKFIGLVASYFMFLAESKEKPSA